jgi:hypothetical protein
MPIIDNGDGVHHLDGRRLAYRLRGKSSGQRAVLAVILCADGLVLSGPTDKQLAGLFGVSVGTLKEALALPPHDRFAVLHGARPLIAPETRLERTVRRHGIEQTWNAITREIG